MIEIDDNLRRLYKNDSLPNVAELSYKQLFLYFPDLNLTISNDQIVSDSFCLDESLCSDEDLTFGSCESAQLKVTVADVYQDLKGQNMIVTQIVNGTYQMPLGTYVVDSAKKQSDMRFKDIIAYDNMRKFDIDVSTWYNGLTFPLTLHDFRESLCSNIGISIFEQTLPNDSMQVTKTISTTVLSGRDVLRRIAEINGTFGHITRDNQLKFIGLSNIGIYPSETLYPADDLFPAESSEFLGNAGYKNSQYEEYEVQSIDKLLIREQEGDIGVTVGSGTNGYIIEGNFLAFGKSSSDLMTVANNLFLMIKNKRYRPHTTSIVGLPYIEVGDAISIVTSTDVIETFVFKRTLTGIQALNDEISASGSEVREQNFGISAQIEQLRGQTVKISSDVNGLTIKVTGPDGIESIISQMSQQIQLKVESDDVQNMIDISLAGVMIKASQIELEGFTTVNGSFGVDTDGTAFAKTIRIENIEGKGGYLDVVGALRCSAILINDEYVWSKDRLYELFTSLFSPSTHGHATGNTIGASFSTSSTGAADLITFTNTSGSDNAATANFVNAKVANTSDKRLKKNINELGDITDDYMKLQPVEFDWKLKDGHDTGYISQQVREIFPELVRRESLMSSKEKKLCPDGILEIKHNNLHPLHTRMIQKHEKEIQELSMENSILRNELSELKELLNKRGVI